MTPDTPAGASHHEGRGCCPGEDTPPSSGISRDQAVQVATDHVGSLAEEASHISARRGRVTDDHRATPDMRGAPHGCGQRTPVWIVTFAGVTFRGRGGPRRAPGHRLPSCPARTVHVVVNAQTGTPIMLDTDP